MKFQNIISSEKFNSFSEEKKRIFLIEKGFFVKLENPYEKPGIYQNWLSDTYHKYKINEKVIEEYVKLFLKKNKLSKDLIKNLERNFKIKKNNKKYIAKTRNKYENSLIAMQHIIDFYTYGEIDSEKLLISFKARWTIKELDPAEIENFITGNLDSLKYNHLLSHKGIIQCKNAIKFINELDLEEISDDKLNYLKDKVMFMNELGVLEFLIEKFNLNINNSVNPNKLSEIISHFTDLNKGTLQKCLNSMYNTHTDQRDNPYNTKQEKAYKKRKEKVEKFINRFKGT